MRIERIGGSRLDTDSEVWGLDQTTWELMWAGEAAMRKSIPALRQAGYKSISDLPRIQQRYREKALVVIPQAMRICTTLEIILDLPFGFPINNIISLYVQLQTASKVFRC